MKSQNKYLVIFFCLLVFLALTVLISLMTGRYMLMPTQVINILSNGNSAAAFDMESAVIWNLRIPRILLNILVGGALAIAGTVFQGIFRNPLVSPDILGVSSGAAFGAALGILISGINIYATGFALIFGIASVCLTYSLARLRNQIIITGFIRNDCFCYFRSIDSFN